MQRKTLESASIYKIGYNKKTLVLTVTFRNKKVYEYYDVPEELAFDVINAKSVGGALAQYVKSDYEYKHTKTLEKLA